MRTLFVSLTILLTICLHSGCSKNGTPQADTAPLEAAIKKYLSEKHMDMKVSKFKEVKIDGNKATAKCAMKAASEMAAGIAVSWEFTFEKKDGAWQVTGLKQ